MSDPFNVPEQEQTPQPRFGQLEIEYEEKTNKNGGTYTDYTIHIYPVADGQDPSKREFSFAKGWQKIVQPSLHRMVQEKRVDNTMLLATGGCWVKYQWSEYKSYDGGDIARNKQNYPEGNKKDDDNVIYASIRSIQILDVFADEDICLAAHDNHFKIEDSVFSSTDDSVPTGLENDALKVEPVPGETALAFIDGYKDEIKTAFRDARDTSGKSQDVDLEKAKVELTKRLPMMANLPLDDPKVQALIKEVEDEPPF